MLVAAGAPLEHAADGALRISRPSRPLVMPMQLHVPGDPSSAAFLAAAASLVPESEVEIQSVCTNPTRLGFFRAMTRMGGNLEFRFQAAQAGEEVAHVTCRHGELRATDILPSEIPALIDEVPILSVVATQARGTTTVRGASELRHKESDRIAQLVSGLRAMGAQADEFPDGLAIHGPVRLRGASIDSMGDHRIAMSFAVAGLVAEGETIIEGAEWADISFPGFFDLLSQLTGSAQYFPSPSGRG
jgi:3-phosphoshikimate 1-carboxyvinyltransferase